MYLGRAGVKDGETESLPRRDMESFHGSDVSGDAGTSC